ncbi:MAG: GTP 3',8-cyclase MoaA [Nanoarchaeota archaeon]|nr:GTP 3',8-cyclase MoaA [Nanoarchaeota archaeon]
MIDYLRVSITGRCNLSCDYCHREGNSDTSDLSLDKFKEIIKAAHDTGFRKLKLTGGEPLLHPHLIDMISSAKSTGFKDISLVTNGLMLHEKAEALRAVGLDRLNIGCDSLTGPSGKTVQKISAGLRSAKEAGFDPVKLNMVVLKGINDHKIQDMISFAAENDVMLQLIELIPLGCSPDFFKRHFFSLDDVEKDLSKGADKTVERGMQGRKQYHYQGAIVEVVGPHKDDFCANCTKLRVDNHGFIKPCLKDDTLIDFNGQDSLKLAIKMKEVKKMIDISSKEITPRTASASGRIVLKKATMDTIKQKKIKKGDPFEASKTAAMYAVKNTHNLIPYCHPLPVESVKMDFEMLDDGIRMVITVKARYRTGVEMEALNGVLIGLSTIWDMVKYLEKDSKGQYPDTRITDVRIDEKTKGA